MYFFYLIFIIAILSFIGVGIVSAIKDETPPMTNETKWSWIIFIILMTIIALTV